MAKRVISIDELDRLEIDEDGNLYWQGNRVLTEIRLSLPRLANVAIVLAGLGTFGLFMVAVGQAVGTIPSPEREITVHLTIKHQDLQRPKSSTEAGQTSTQD